jgi:hypothetical protein
MRLGISSYPFSRDVGAPGHEPESRFTERELLGFARTR